MQIQREEMYAVSVCLLFGANAHEYVQTHTGSRDFVLCQCSKPDWQCFLNSQMLLLWSFSFIRLGQNTKPECWNKLSGFPKAPYLSFWFCSCKEGFQRLLSSPAHGACSHHRGRGTSEQEGCIGTRGIHFPLKNAPFQTLLLGFSWPCVRQEEMLRTDAQKR